MPHRFERLRAALETLAGLPLDDAALQALQGVLERAASGHPDLVVSEHRWAEQLWTGLENEPPQTWASRLDRLVAPDVLLAVGLSVGDKYALGVFEERFAPSILATLQRLRLGREELAELLQRARVHILVAAPPDRPRITRYGGKGSLEGWVRTTALRLAMRYLDRAGAHGAPVALEGLGVPAQTEPGRFRARRHQQLRTVVGDAFAELPPRSRRLLRTRYIDGRTAVDIAAEHGVHESTMSRWLADAREELSRRIRGRAQALMGSDEVHGARLIETLATDVEASLRGLFDTRPNR